MNGAGGVDDAAFVAAVAGTTAALEGLANGYLAMNERHGYLQAADSRAMGELAREAEFSARGWVEPVHDAHVMAGMLTYAGIDHMVAYAHLFASGPIPVYAYLTVARAAIEAFAWGYWLADPHIDCDSRVRRGRMFQLDDGMQRKRLPDKGSKETGRRIIARVREGVPKGWPVVCNDSRIAIGHEEFPATTDAIGAVLGTAGGRVERDLGASLWCFLSGVSHARRYALIDSMQVVRGDDRMGPLLGALGTTASTVHLIGTAVARACIGGCDARFALLGWDRDPMWRGAVKDAERQIQAVLRAIEEQAA